MSARDVARCAVMTALLIAIQYVLGFVPGVELVTVTFAAFCAVFGAKCGIFTAISFSLLRCLLYGFVLNIVLLYLIYYTIFAALFGTASVHKLPAKMSAALLIAMSLAGAVIAIKGLPVSALYSTGLRIMVAVLSVILAIFVIGGLCISDKLLKKVRFVEIDEILSATALAAVLTVFFTLLDDCITPLMLGFSREAATAYFYAGFLTMIPQAVCVTLSMILIYPPLIYALRRINN